VAVEQETPGALKAPDFASGITNDRELLDLLGLNDAQASMYLGRSRQALQNKLKSKSRGTAPNDYFKPHDILLLVIAARRLGRLGDTEQVMKVQRYVQETRAPDYGKNDSYKVLLDALGGADDDFEKALAAALAVIIIVPDYGMLNEARPGLARRLVEVAAAAETQPSNPWIVALASTEARANSAAQAFALSTQRFIAKPSHYTDHYTPMVLIYSGAPERPEPRPFILTETGQLVAAPYFSGAMQTACVRQMLPDEVRNDLFGAEAAGVRRDKRAATGGR
jgi:hypothetical protein